MIYTAIAGSWAVVLILLWVLLAGQPAAVQDYQYQLATSTAEVARLQATMRTIATPTPSLCWVGTIMRRDC